MGPNETHQQVLRKVADKWLSHYSSCFTSHSILAKSLLSGKGENNSHYYEEDSGCYRPVSLTLVPGKILEQILMDTRLRHMENKGVTDHSQNGFTKGKSRLTHLVVLYNRVTAVMEKGKATDFIYLDLCKAYDTVLHNILVSKLKSREFDNGTLSGYGVSWIAALKESQSTARCPSGDQRQMVFLKHWYWGQQGFMSFSATCTTGLRAPSAGLLMAPSCGVWLTYRREGIPYRGTLTGLRGGTVWDLMKFSNLQLQGPACGL